MAKLSLESCASPKRRRGKEHRAAQRNARAKGPTRVTSRRAQVPRHVARGTSPAKRRAPCRRKRYARSTRARALVLSTTSEALSKRRHLDAILTVLHPCLSNDAGQGERGIAHRRARGEHG